MIKSRLYLYDKDAEGYKGVEFTSHILLGERETNDLTEELDTKDITLSGLNIKEAFEPTTKFIEELYENDTLVETQHWIVQQDLVTKPILADNNYYKHSLSLIEPSAIAQQRTCDTFATSYKLSDIKLEASSIVDTDIISFNIGNTPRVKEITNSHSFTWTNNYTTLLCGVSSAMKYNWKFANSAEEEKWRNFKQYQEVGSNVSLTLPLIQVQEVDYFGEVTKTLGCCSTDYVVKKTQGGRTYYLNESNQWQEQQVIRRIDPAVSSEGNWQQQTIMKTGTAASADFRVNGTSVGWIVNRVVCENRKQSNYEIGQIVYYLKQVAHYIQNPQNRNVSFVIETGAKYEIIGNIHNFQTPQDSISVWNFSSGSGSSYTSNFDGSGDIYNNVVGGLEGVQLHIKYDTIYYPTRIIRFSGSGKNKAYSLVFEAYNFIASLQDFTAISSNEPFVNATTISYAEGGTNYYISSAPPANAYELFLKSIIVSQSLNKTQDTWEDFLNELSFYTSENDKAMLQGTQIVETIYSQKNLWEMFIEIGKYIHSIPRVVFGENDRFLVQWDKLGLAGADYTKEDNATHISIYNSKKLEEYISACDSYITNMVQLGGLIDEWVAPKSTSEDYLVYNDVALIKTSKPILEIVNMEVQCSKTDSTIGMVAGATRNLVGKGTSSESKYGYVFESSVYQLLDIQSTTNVNKGMAIYYELGKDEITGFTYKLPTTSAGDPEGEYAIKKILGSVFGIDRAKWKELKVNDFVFHIVYRTKDSLREVQTRPDLRKYMLNSQFDRAPIHKQFNNQTDIVLDSIKFGDNIYGKLIKTGNLGYTMTEWCADYSEIKKVGMLYNINGNLYYLSKITKVYEGTQVMCQLEFSKDYNQLSAIIGIPSEPRFYEISERNLIEREVVWNEYFMIGTSNSSVKPIIAKDLTYLSNILFGNETSFPKYAAYVLKNIIDKPLNNENLKGNETFYKTFMLPLSVYSCKNTLSLECDTADNFSAGDQVSLQDAQTAQPSVDSAYRSLMPYQYCDPMGRGDMYEFAIINPNLSTKYDDIRNMPQCPYGNESDKIAINNSDLVFYNDNFGTYLKKQGAISNKEGLMLLKDSREKLSFNYNLQMLTDSDRFVLSGYLWQLNKNSVRLVLLNDEINKVSNDTIPIQYISGWTSVFNDYSAPFSTTKDGNYAIKINIKAALEAKFTTEQIENAKAIAIVSSNVSSYNTNEQYFVVGRNVSDLSYDEKVKDWYLKDYDVSMAKVNTDIPE